MIAATESHVTDVADLLFLSGRRNGLLVMLAAFLDASGKTEDVRLPDRRVLAVAGYVAPSGAWKKFARKWKRFLKDFDLTLAHHKEFAARQGEYRGWPEDRRRAYVTRGARIINQIAHYGAVVAVDLKAYQKVELENPSERSAFTFAALVAVQTIGRWAGRSKKGERVAYFFEAGDGHDEELFQIEREIFADPRAIDIYQLNSFTIVPKNNPDTVQLQPSDWLAWEAAKYVKDTTFQPEEPRPPRHSLIKLMKPDKLVVRLYDEESLLKLRDAIRRGEGRLYD